MLVGYGLGRWQGASTDPVVAAQATSTKAPLAAGAPSVTTSTSGNSATASSASTPAPADYPTLRAAAASGQNGTKSQDTQDLGGGRNVGWIANGDSLRFDGFDFGSVPATRFEARLASDENGGSIEIHLDSPTQPAIGTLSVTRTGGWQSWRTDAGKITLVTGVHTVFLIFVRNDNKEFVNINWIHFQH